MTNEKMLELEKIFTNDNNSESQELGDYLSKKLKTDQAEANARWNVIVNRDFSDHELVRLLRTSIRNKGVDCVVDSIELACLSEKLKIEDF
tara:strand:+ start:15683 stop:15955 length:273 start_codon:yes stop_codon:yes gene_type:complete